MKTRYSGRLINRPYSKRDRPHKPLPYESLPQILLNHGNQEGYKITGYSYETKKYTVTDLAGYYITGVQIELMQPATTGVIFNNEDQSIPIRFVHDNKIFFAEQMGWKDFYEQMWQQQDTVENVYNRFTSPRLSPIKITGDITVFIGIFANDLATAYTIILSFTGFKVS